ncbi:zinc-ribbon domain-containing protein [Ruminococcus sp.]|uniref:zinc ribbon domain-containing protein n=1 Tax=Ruminococcus sp. TaxID=41978 RepID=UPI003EFDD6B9
MNKSKRNPALVAIGIILIIIGIIIFIVSAVQLYEVQTTRTHWIEGFMQDYQARTNATNSIPCYIFMALSAVMVIAGIVMLAVKPKSNVVVLQNTYSNLPNTDMQNSAANNQPNFCPNCGNKIDSNSKFCDKCGHPLR